MRSVIAATVLAAGTATALAGANRGAATLSEILPIQSDAAEQRGQIDRRDFDLDQPALASMLQRLLASPPTDAAADRQIVTLRRLHLDFERSADRLIIRSGSACHDAFAATIAGYMDLPAGALHFAGVVWFATDMPPFLRNPLPVIPIWTNRAASGAPAAMPVSVSYQLAGSAAAPMLRLNPFPDEYPGALRQVAEACDRPDWQRR